MIKNLRELYQYRALLWSLTVRELRARYRASVLGFLWTFLNPTLSMAVYALVFGKLMPNPDSHYPYTVFAALLPWIYFSSSIAGGASSVSDRRDLLTKVRFPAQVLPATVVATNLVNYLLSLPLLIALGLVFGVTPTWHFAFFIPMVLLQTLFTLALTYLLSALNVAFRDLQHIVVNLLQLAFFLTPVLWRIGLAPEWAHRPILYLNPMAALVNGYRDIFVDQHLPHYKPLLAVTGVSFALLWVGSVVFERRREEFAELI
ncbi:MAG: ABC transporter permease [Archangiaceae bacterium]|nr:ABC transporter permease [Archangiaceae bacterium]